MVPFQLVNDEEIGELANTNNSSYLDMFRARELLRKKFNNYLNQQLFTSNLDCRILFYLNDTLPMVPIVNAYTLSEHVALRTCQVYSSRLVKDQEWYKRTEKITWSPYFFINKDTDELCYSKYVYNYALNSSSEGIGTVVIAIPENAFLGKNFCRIHYSEQQIFSEQRISGASLRFQRSFRTAYFSARFPKAPDRSCAIRLPMNAIWSVLLP